MKRYKRRLDRPQSFQAFRFAEADVAPDWFSLAIQNGDVVIWRDPETTIVEITCQHGVVRGSTGDWVLLDRGNMHICSDETFQELYESAD